MGKYFTIGEMCCSATRPDLVEVPAKGTQMYRNLERLIEVMDKIREAWGGPIIVTSGFRPKDTLNKAVGGSPTSAHCVALACDFHPKDGDILKLAAKILSLNLDFDQLILEKIFRNGNRIGGCQWIHLGLTTGKARKQVLAYDGKKYLPVTVNNTTTFSV